MYYKEWFGNGDGALRRRGVKLDNMKGGGGKGEGKEEKVKGKGKEKRKGKGKRKG
jgi:hypothetical protein